ncbi:crotonase/enoyl-CoA hydratase family protein [Pseudonocardia spinosispora]|uniref:crotonase/enoyl-CoA hydratase family protein n=1 Tax=Pseudonocardia spinosispora TaxID=103441 RepID=UPI00040B6F05|nr:crotonase/enoyl-CoA hydratase family protein [Pseudonocardia spinosispora]
MSSALLSNSNASNVMSLGQTTLAGRHDTVRATLGDGVAEVRLNRPAKLNALNIEMFDDLLEVGLMIRRDPTVRAVVLTGEGRAFCAGLDYAALAELENDVNPYEDDYSPGDELLEPDDQLVELSRSQRAACVWGTVPAPVIAALNGPAFGGGLQLALPADIRIVAPETILSVAEVRWGLTPDMAGTQLLPRLVGMDVAMELTLTGQVITGEEALRIGLATRVDDEPRDAAMMLAREIAKRNPDAVRTAKSLLDSAWHVSMGDGLAAERHAAELIARSPNQREAMRARLQRRIPNFVDSPED